jgi:hypothetical protein
MQRNHNTKRDAAQAVKIRRADGKVIGLVVNGVFKKTVKASKHFLHTPPAIAFDLCAIADAKANGATVAEVTDAETGAVYRATIARIWQRGFHVDRKHGNQIALLINEWNRGDEVTADQLTLL